MDIKNRRKIILINKKFQIKMITKFILLNILLMTIFGIMIYVFTNSEIESNLNRAHITYNNVKDMLIPIVITLSAINIILSSVIITGFVLFASFRIAGPLYRFNTVVEDVGNRKLHTITSLRKDDQLYECSLSLQNTIMTLAQDITGMQNCINELEKLGKESLSEIAGKEINELKNILSKYELK